MNNDKLIYSYQSEKILKLNSINKIEKDFKEKYKWYSVFFKKYLPDDKSIIILDLPCGHGNISYFLKSKGYINYSGYDIDQGRIDIAHLLGLNCFLGNGLEIIKTKTDIDIIFSLDFLEHLGREEAFDFIVNCYKSLRNGGKLIVRMPISDNLMGTYDLYNDLTHKWTSNSNCIISLFELAGFQRVVVKDERPVLYKPFNYIRYCLFLIFSNIHNLYLKLLGFPGYKIWSKSAYFIAYK